MRNVEGMSAHWTEAKRQEVLSLVTSSEADFARHADTIRQSTPRALLDVGGAAETIAKAKIDMDTTIEGISRKTQELQGIVARINEETASIKSSIDTSRTTVKTTQGVVEKAKQVHTIREEQNMSLNKKREGNYHSSWMGLWRPMGSESRLAIFLLSIAFFLLSLVGIAYIISRTNILSRTPDFSAWNPFKNRTLM
jgi:hypothetical protein